jgi:hypothetical protein
MPRATKPAGKKSAKAKSRAKETKRDPNTSTRSTEQAGVGTKAHPRNKRVPAAAIIQRETAPETGTKVTASPEVQGDQALQIIDLRMLRPVHVSLIKGTALTKDTRGDLIFIQGPVSNNLVPIANARSLFAVKKDGTVIYNDRGFDEVSAGAEFDMLDIEKLIEHNNK